MPKPKFEMKKSDSTKISNPPINGIEIKLNPSDGLNPSQSILQATTDVTKAIPITVIPNSMNVRTAQVRISQ